MTHFVVVIAKLKDLMLDSTIDCLECNYQSYKNLNRVIACEAEIISSIWTHYPHSSFSYYSKNQCSASLLLLGIKMMKIGKSISRNVFLSFKI